MFFIVDAKHVMPFFFRACHTSYSKQQKKKASNKKKSKQQQKQEQIYTACVTTLNKLSPVVEDRHSWDKSISFNQDRKKKVYLLLRNNEHSQEKEKFWSFTPNYLEYLKNKIESNKQNRNKLDKSCKFREIKDKKYIVFTDLLNSAFLFLKA